MSMIGSTISSVVVARCDNRTVAPAVDPRLSFDRLPARPCIVEVGPGTGQATRDLLRRGAVVHAIEASDLSVMVEGSARPRGKHVDVPQS
jgi:SAM-dependent MidA family methyltransferase